MLTGRVGNVHSDLTIYMAGDISFLEVTRKKMLAFQFRELTSSSSSLFVFLSILVANIFFTSRYLQVLVISIIFSGFIKCAF